MKDLAIDIDGDLDFTTGIIQGEEVVVQALKLQLSTNLTEWFLDLSYGLDRSVLTDNFRPDEINDVVADVIAKESRVELENYVTSTFDSVKRKVMVNFTVNLISTGQPIEMEVEL